MSMSIAFVFVLFESRAKTRQTKTLKVIATSGSFHNAWS
jgi:hypothetical protein